MTPKERAAMQQALDALEAVSTAKERGFGIEYAKGYVDPVIAALREALAEQAEQEPVAVVDANDDGYWADILPDKSVKVGQKLYAAPVRTKDLTDVADLQDAVTKALKKAFHLGQTYWQQADSESYAANKRANVTQELYWKLEGDTRAVIAADREKNK